MLEKIRVTCDLALDDARDADIIETIRELARSRKLGGLMSGIMKYAFDDKERAEKLIRVLTDGKRTFSPNRDEFFEYIRSQVREMAEKVNEMYKMNVQLLSAFSFGKKLGLEKKAENMTLANFMLEKQLTDLSKALGVEMTDAYDSNKVKDAREYADDIVEYIINTYAECMELYNRAEELAQRPEREVYQRPERLENSRGIEPSFSGQSVKVKPEPEPAKNEWKEQSSVSTFNSVSSQEKVETVEEDIPIMTNSAINVVTDDGSGFSILGNFGDAGSFGSDALSNFLGGMLDDDE